MLKNIHRNVTLFTSELLILITWNIKKKILSLTLDKEIWMYDQEEFEIFNECYQSTNQHNEQAKSKLILTTKWKKNYFKYSTKQP